MTEHRTIETGSYVGDETARSILLPWQPAWLRILNDRTGGPAQNKSTAFKMPSMAAALMANLNTVIDLEDGITITSTGFDLGTSDPINNSGSNFYWTAHKPGPWQDVGSYVGSGGTTSVVLGRQPVAVLLVQTTIPGSQSERIWWKTDTMASALAFQMRLSIASVNEITITSTGFDVTGNADDSGEGYAYVAFYELVGSTVHTRVGTYTGAGGSRSISLGAQPKAVMIINEGTPLVGLASDTMPTGNHGDIDTAYAWDSGSTGIVFVADGFDVSSKWDVSSEVYHWIAEMR